MELLAYPIRLLIVLVLILTSSASLAQRSLTNIAIHNTEPDFLIRALEPHLSTGSSISHYRNQLIINATAAELARIKPLIKQLDGSGQQLVFSLRREGGHEGTRQAIKVEGSPTITSSNNRGIQLETHSTVTVRNRSFSGNSQSGQGVRASEGAAAYIATGTSGPIKIYSSTMDGKAYQQQATTPANSGFYATAWIDEDTVSVTLDQRDDHYQQHTISSQQLQSRVSGKLGTWMAIGVIVENQQTGQRQLNSRSSHSANNTTMLYLKVELLP
jgi:hypothetical protein